MPAAIDTCRRRIEENDPPIKSLEIECFIHEKSQSVRVKMKCHPKNFKPQQYYVYNDFHFRDEDAWRNIGQALANNMTLSEVSVNGDVNATIKPASARCLEVFYSELKENRSIAYFLLDLLPSKSVAMFDLGYFLRNNRVLNHLVLKSEEQLSSEQSALIAAALQEAAPALRNFEIYKGMFGDGESFGQVVSACSQIENLALSCEKDYQFSALSALLRDPKAVLREVHLYPDKVPGDNMDEGMSQIAASLVHNTTLKKIVIRFGFGGDLNAFGPLLCDASSIESIHRSNHTLEQIVTVNYLPAHIAECLELNKITDKNEVIRKKVERFYSALDEQP